jgi:hypothetical protein
LNSKHKKIRNVLAGSLTGSIIKYCNGFQVTGWAGSSYCSQSVETSFSQDLISVWSVTENDWVVVLFVVELQSTTACFLPAYCPVDF